MAEINIKIKMLEAKLLYLKKLHDIVVDHVRNCYERGEDIVQDLRHDHKNMASKVFIANQELEKLLHSVYAFSFDNSEVEVFQGEACPKENNSQSLLITKQDKQSCNELTNGNCINGEDTSECLKKQKFIPKIPEPIPDNSLFYSMIYLQGDSPWNFWLGFSEPKEINVERALQNRKDSKALSHLRNKPNEGDYICARVGKSLVRGKVLSSFNHRNECLVLSVDTGTESYISFNKMYALDKDLASIPAQAIKCSLKNEYRDALEWDDYMGKMFKVFMMKENILVAVINKIEGTVAKYIVDIRITDEDQYSDEHKYISVTDWILSLVPTATSMNGSFLTSKVETMPKEQLQISPEVKNKVNSEVSEQESIHPFGSSEHSDTEISNISFPNLLLVGFRGKVIVTHIVSPTEFYVNLASNKSLLKKLSTKINAFYNEFKLTCSNKDDARKQIGTFCACFHVDSGLWRRGEVIDWNPNVSKDHVVVYCLDTGNTATLSWKFLRPLNSQFFQVKPLAIKCHLANVFPLNSTRSKIVSKWSDDAISVFKSILEADCIFDIAVVDQDKNVNPISHSVLLIYTQMNGEVMVNDDLVKLNCAISFPHVNKECDVQEVQDPDNIQESIYQSDEEFAVSHNVLDRPNHCSRDHNLNQEDILNSNGFTKEISYNFCTQLVLPAAGSVISIEVTHVKSIDTFYAVILNYEVDVELQDQENEILIKINSLLNNSKNIKSMRSLTSPVVIGQLALAKFHEDGRYYRARVIEKLEAAFVDIFYVDYGNTETVAEEDLKEAESEYLYYPAQAVECQLANFSPHDALSKEDEEAAVEFFVDLVLNKKLRARIVNTSSDTKMAVLLYNNGLDIGNTLINFGHGYKKYHTIQTSCI